MLATDYSINSKLIKAKAFCLIQNLLTPNLCQSFRACCKLWCKVNNSNSVISSFNKSTDGKYTELDSLYSNDYVFNVFTHRRGLSYSLFQKKIKLNFGGDVGFTNFHQTIHLQILLLKKFCKLVSAG